MESDKDEKFNLANVDDYWMTTQERRFFEILKNPENRLKDAKEISRLAGFKSLTAWYKAIKDESFAKLLISMGVKIRKRQSNFMPHSEIRYIEDYRKRLEYLEDDTWDMRKIFYKYQKNISPYYYIISFDYIHSISIKDTIKRYFEEMLPVWQVLTFHHKYLMTKHFVETMQQTFPEINSLSQLKRSYVEEIIKTMLSKYNASIIHDSLVCIKQMFKYMYDSKWKDAPETYTLIVDYDIPKRTHLMPTFIPSEVKYQLDNYLEHKIIPLLEKGESTPIVPPEYWDLIIILRYTGVKFKYISHLISDNSDRDCLKYDSDGDLQFFVDSRVIQSKNDIYISLARFKDNIFGRNIVEEAVKRQKDRVRNLPPAEDGFLYLFREPVRSRRGIEIKAVTYNKFNNNTILPKVCKQIPLKDKKGNLYKISADQFRHTVAGEMIEKGIDIYAIKDFLELSSISRTRKYIESYWEEIEAY